MEYNINITNVKDYNQNPISYQNHFQSFKSNSDTLTFKKKKLIEISKNLTKLEYLEIFNILQEDSCNYTENKNGIFINLLNVKEITIDKIFAFVDFIKHKREDLLNHEEYLETVKKSIKELNELNNNFQINNNNSFINNDNIDNYNKDYDDDLDNNYEKSRTYLDFSSDEDEDLDNKLSLKKKKIKYTGKKAKMMKSIKDGNDPNKMKLKNKKTDEEE